MNRERIGLIIAVFAVFLMAGVVYAESQERICIYCGDHSEFVWGADLYFYSDEASTQKYLIDGATGNVDGEGTLNNAGAVVLQSTLNGQGAVDLDTTLNVDGASTLSSVSVSGATALNAINYDVDVSKVTTNTVVTDAESGTLYANMGATTEITLTLPVAVVGTNYCIYVADAYTITVSPDVSDTIHHLTNAAGDRLQNAGTAGDSVCLTAVDGTYWVPLQEIGTWSDVD